MKIIDKDSAEKIEESKAKRIAVQLPEGLKTKAGKVYKELKDISEECEIYFMGEPCYGACDLRDHEAKASNCDLLVHFGHSTMNHKTEIPVVYIEVRSDLDIKKVVESAVEKISEKNIGIITTVQHLHQLEKIEKILKDAGKNPYIGEASNRVTHKGQILGCDLTAAKSIDGKVDCYLYVGSGNFHPLGIALSTKKKVYVADPEMGNIRELSDLADQFLRKRFAKIEKAKEAKTFGIILSSKEGQHRRGLATALREKLEKAGKDVYIIIIDQTTPEKLMGFMFDAYVCTACSRIPFEDESLYEKPMLTPQEAEIVLGERKWENYEVDHF